MIDFNLLAYEYQKNLFTPREIYPSGERDENRFIDKYTDNKEGTILILENDIINKDGYGLKKGFYNIKPDKYMDFLLIYQGASLKAKVPVIKMNVIESASIKQQKPKKMSARKLAIQREKERRKYFDGENPEEIEWSEAKINYIDEKNAWILVYNSNNIELIGMIKL